MLVLAIMLTLELAPNYILLFRRESMAGFTKSSLQYETCWFFLPLPEREHPVSTMTHWKFCRHTYSCVVNSLHMTQRHYVNMSRCSQHVCSLYYANRKRMPWKLIKIDHCPSRKRICHCLAWGWPVVDFRLNLIDIRWLNITQLLLIHNTRLLCSHVLGSRS